MTAVQGDSECDGRRMESSERAAPEPGVVPALDGESGTLDRPREGTKGKGGRGNGGSKEWKRKKEAERKKKQEEQAAREAAAGPGERPTFYVHTIHTEQHVFVFKHESQQQVP